MRKVAVVHDDFIQFGGAERLVLAMLEIFPEADLFATVVTDRWLDELVKLGYDIKVQSSKFKNTGQKSKILQTSWLQRLPSKEKLFRYYYSLYPLAIESFRFDGYDLVISSSARYAHGVLTKPSTIHVAYVNSPARFLYEEELQPKNWLVRPIIAWHRAWDRVAAKRPDYIIANSKTPAERVKKYWGREVEAIIYPFVDLKRFERPSSIGLNPKGSNPGGEEGYFLVVSRLKKWKRIEISVQACNELRLPLIVVGAGEDEGRLKKMAGPTIRFLSAISDEQLADLYRGCRALIMTQEEDFGLTALEAQACGKSVIAYAKGGVLETVLEGVTGLFFYGQSADSLGKALNQFDPRAYIGENCSTQARKFSKERFKKELKEFIENVLSRR